jgi:hypothetical protein
MMVNCRRFTDLVASGELDEAGWLTRVQAGQHRLVCRRCRTFERNDRQLDGILRAHREQLLHVDREAAGEQGTSGAAPEDVTGLRPDRGGEDEV